MIAIGAILIAVGIAYLVGSFMAFVACGVVLLLIPISLYRSWREKRIARLNTERTGNPFGLPGCKGKKLDEFGIPILDDQDDVGCESGCRCEEIMGEVKRSI